MRAKKRIDYDDNFQIEIFKEVIKLNFRKKFWLKYFFVKK